MYSVIVPSLGRLNYLNELIESIGAQTFQPLEIIILLDDNEHCREISSAIKTNKLLKILFCTGLNLAQKRNYGALIAQSEYLIFSDDDDIWMSTRGKKVCEALGVAPVCCHNYGKFGAVIANDCSKLGMKDRRLNAKAMLVGSNRFGGGSAIAARRYVVLALPFSHKFRYCEDFEWWSRILFSEIEVQYIGDSLVKYRTHATNMTNAVTTISLFGQKISLKLMTNGFLMVIVAIMITLRSLVRTTLHLLRNAKSSILLFWLSIKGRGK